MDYQDYFKNKPEYLLRRSKLRRNQTKSEKVLWHELKAKRFGGFRFRRQFQIGKYIVDFYCHSLRLIIELDGPIHEHQSEYDRKREKWLVKQEYVVVRYLNDEVLFEREAMLRHLAEVVKKRNIEVVSNPSQPPLLGEG